MRRQWKTFRPKRKSFLQAKLWNSLLKITERKEMNLRRYQFPESSPWRIIGWFNLAETWFDCKLLVANGKMCRKVSEKRRKNVLQTNFNQKVPTFCSQQLCSTLQSAAWFETMKNIDDFLSINNHEFFAGKQTCLSIWWSLI